MLIEQPSNIYGLKYQPSFSNPSFNYLDSFGEYDRFVQSQQDYPLYHGPIDFTYNNQLTLQKVFLQVKHLSGAIVEIGVSRDEENNSTNILLNNKSADSKYIGIDLREIDHLANPAQNVFTLSKTNSFETEKIRSFITNKAGLVSFILIDGDHSINTVLNDWAYSDLLTEGGIVFFHDTNHHPGPREVFKAIDENLFDKHSACPFDYGVSWAIKKKMR